MANVTDDHLQKVIDGIYEAAIEPQRWRDTLQDVSNVLGAEGSVLLGYPSSLIGLHCSPGLDELAVTFIQEGWHLQNVRAHRHRATRHMRTVATESDLMTQSELDRHPFYSEFMTKKGFRWGMGAILGDYEDTSLVISTERLDKQGRFETIDVATLAAFVPHLKRSVHIAARISLSRAEGVLDGFESLQVGGILLDHNGRVRRLNKAAEAQLGVSYTVSHGYLHATAGSAEKALQLLVGSVVGTQNGLAQPQSAVLPRPTGRPVIAYGLPLRGAAMNLFQPAKALLVVIDPDRMLRPQARALKQAFNFTDAEAEVALALTRGLNLSEVAMERGVSPATVRVHLRSLLGKTGTHRQTELVLLVLNCVGPEF